MIALLLLYRSRAKQKAVINYSQPVPRHRAAREKSKAAAQTSALKARAGELGSAEPGSGLPIAHPREAGRGISMGFFLPAPTGLG